MLGQYYSSCGRSTVFEFVNKFLSGTDGQAQIFCAFMKNEKPDALEGLRNHDWEAVARAYNGKHWQSTNPNYATDLAKYYAEAK
ncbi:N-acetylmuramidase domain-containing protein [Paraburkholderia sp. J76]|uniref:N-acetylmuramidase domain-containing protein n=1 Tax=Paraburkholderia sp. J76 TaxID=2805439 RepID=UPI0039F63B65